MAFVDFVFFLSYYNTRGGLLGVCLVSVLLLLKIGENLVKLQDG